MTNKIKETLVDLIAISIYSGTNVTARYTSRDQNGSLFSN
jgi:hypothetical protein